MSYEKRGKTNRRKGHNFERQVANDLKEIFPEAKRHLEYQASECQGVDIDNTGKYRIQCKNTKKYVPVNTIKEIKCHPTEVPVVVCKAAWEPSMAILPWEELKVLLRNTYLKESDEKLLEKI